MSDIRAFVSTVPRDPISAFIRGETDCLWSHMGWVRLSDGWTFSAMFDGGVIWRPPNPKARVLVLTCDGMDASLAKALTKEGEHYDWLGIVGMALRKNLDDSKLDFCDKLFIWAQNEVGCPIVNTRFIPIYHFSPADVLKSLYINEDKAATGDLIKRGLAAEWDWAA